MSKADEYRVRAAHCKSRAEEAIGPRFKREFEQLAAKWNDLADQEEADGRSGLDGPACVGQRRGVYGRVTRNVPAS